MTRDAALRWLRRYSFVPALLVTIVAVTALTSRASPDGGSATTIRVSVSASGAQADGESTGVALSGDARYVAFVSFATNLVQADTNNLPDVFVRDREEGTLVRASLATGGSQADGSSWAPSLSADGRYVAFASDAWNLVAGDGNEVSDVFVRDLVEGTTVRASASSSGAAADGPSTNPVLSADGRYVAFESRASNFVAGDGNGDSDVFLRDLVAGTTERVSVGTGSVEGLGPSRAPAISADGRFVSFASGVSNWLGVGGDTNATWDIYLRDRLAGTTLRASVGAGGAQGNGSSYASALSADGRFVAFESQASDLVPGDTNSRSDAFVRDMQTGATARVSVSASGGQGGGASVRPSISADGRWVLFASEAPDLVAGDNNAAQDVFLRDREGTTIARISLTASGAASQGGSSWPALSGDGRYGAFPSSGNDLVAGDSNGEADVYLRGPLH